MPDDLDPNAQKAPPAPDAPGPAAAAPDAAAPAEEASASERAEGPALDPAALLREVQMLRAALDESQSRARETQQRLVDEHDRLLRTAAEFENYKKRAQKEKEDTRRFGIESLLKEFLPIADNFDRALEASATADAKHLAEGVRLVQKLFENTLAKFGVTSFSAVGQQFDPTLHEALMQMDSDAAPGTVVQEMAKGYRLHDRLVRPAAVVVARAKAPPPEPARPEGAPPSGDGAGTPPQA